MDDDRSDPERIGSLSRTPQPASIRFRVDPRDVPADKAARKLHLTLTEFEQKLPELLARGFPPPDATTGMFDLVAVDEWMWSRHNSLATHAAKAELGPRNAQDVFSKRLASRGTR